MTEFISHDSRDDSKQEPFELGTVQWFRRPGEGDRRYREQGERRRLPGGQGGRGCGAQLGLLDVVLAIAPPPGSADRGGNEGHEDDGGDGQPASSSPTPGAGR